MLHVARMMQQKQEVPFKQSKFQAHEFEWPHLEDARGVVAEPRDELQFPVRPLDADGDHLPADVLRPHPRLAPDPAVHGEGQLRPVVHVRERFLEELRKNAPSVSLSQIMNAQFPFLTKTLSSLDGTDGRKPKVSRMATNASPVEKVYQ